MYIALSIGFILVTLLLIVVIFNIVYTTFIYPGSAAEVVDNFGGYTHSINAIGSGTIIVLWLVLLGFMIELT